jgi:hypothetical protein
MAIKYSYGHYINDSVKDHWILTDNIEWSLIITINYSVTWRLPKVGKLPKIIHFHRIFRSKPSTKWGWTIPSIWPSAISGKKVPWSTCHGFYSLKTTHMTISWSYWGWFLIQLLNLVIVIHCHYDWVYQITIWSICGQFKKILTLNLLMGYAVLSYSSYFLML